MTEGPGRVEAFSDGVFAIAITLLILEIPVPHAGADAPAASLWSGLVALWPSYLAFVLSFFVILIMWVNHHELMRLVRAVGYPFLFANGFVLLMVTFVPFPTAVLAEHLATAEARAAVTFYCGTFVVISLAWNLLFYAIVRGGLLRPGVDAATLRRIRRAYIAGPLVYAAATLVALVHPVAGCRSTRRYGSSGSGSATIRPTRPPRRSPEPGREASAPAPPAESGRRTRP